jgi:hypothetical protein
VFFAANLSAGNDRSDAEEKSSIGFKGFASCPAFDQNSPSGVAAGPV